MEIEQGSQFLSISKRGRPLQELPAIDQNEVGASPQKKGLNLGALIRTMQRKALLIIGITGAVTFVAWNSTKNAADIYQGNFRLLVEPVTNEKRAVDPAALARGEGGAPGGDLDYATQLQILQSPQLLTPILKKVQEKHPKFSYEALRQGLVVQRLQGEDQGIPSQTKIVEVSYQGGEPQLVYDVLVVTANRFLQYSLEERKSSIGQGVEFIDEQLPRLTKQVDDLQEALQKLQQQYKLTDPAQQGQQLFTQLTEITAQQREVQSQLGEQKRLYLNLQNQLALTPGEAIAASALSEDPNYRELQTKIQEIDNEIALESARFSSENPALKTLQDKRQNLLALQRSATQRILGASGTTSGSNPQVLAFQNSVRLDLIKQLVDSANQIQMLEIRDREIARARASLEQRAQQFPTVARQYNDIQQRLDIAKQTRNQLLTRKETLQVESAQKEVPWELVSRPQIPLDGNGVPVPAPSDSSKTLIIGVFAGLVLGMGSAILIEKIRNIFYSIEDIKEAIPFPLLGVIPPYAVTRFAGSAEETDDGNKITTPFQEAFDSLYASIRFLSSDPPVRSLAVCSAAPGDGKSTTALQLAQTAASMGQRVLLVDTNFREPQIHTRLDLPNHKGVSDLLANKLPPNELIQRSPAADNLFVLTSGQPQRNSTKLLASAQMQYLMEEFQATFDLVIYDTPHLRGRVDTNFLAAHTDGILMVVAVRRTKRSLVMQVVNQLNTFRLPILGVVANHVRRGTNIPYETKVTTDLPIVGDELTVHPRI